MNLPELLPPALFTEAFGKLGLPEPSLVTAIDRDGIHALFTVQFGQAKVPDAVLRIEQDARRRASVPVELAAMELARGTLPVPPATALEGLPWPALLLRKEPGAVRPKHRDLPVRLTELLVRLNGLVSPTWGDLVVQGRFVPSETSWRLYWERRIDQALAQAQGTHVSLGWAEALHQAALQGISALDDARFSLVHGDFGPENVLLTDDGIVSAVLDWDDALLGDPLIDWVPSLDAPAKVLAAGVGERSVPVLHDPGAIPRLQVYHRTRALERFAECGRAWNHEPGSRRRAQHLEAAIALARLALEPERVPRRIGSIRGPLPDVAGPVPVPPHRVLRRRVFEILRHPLPPVGLPLASALAAAVEGADLFAEQASTLLRDLPLQREPWAAAPIRDWSASAAAVQVESGLGLALLALGERAFAAVGQHVDDSTRRGLLEQVRTARAQGWQDAVLGYAGAVALGRDPTPFLAGLQAIPAGLEADPDDVFDGLVFVPWLDAPLGVWVPVLCWALPHLPAEAAARVAGQLLG